MAEPSGSTLKEEDVRLSWEVGSAVEVFSASLDTWYPAKIIRILTDEEGEWLECQYDADNLDTRVKQAKRADESVIRPITPATENKSREEKQIESISSTPPAPNGKPSKSTNWHLIDSFSEDHYAKPVVMDGSKLLIASGDQNPNVYRYDFVKQKLKVLFKYPNRLEPFQVSTCIDYNRQKIYLYCTYTSSKDNALMQYDLSTKELITYQAGLKDVGAYPVMCCLGGNIHLVGGRLNSLHLIWDDVDKRFSERPFRSKMIHGHAVIPLQSTKQLVVMGGNDSHLWGGYLAGIWICDTIPSIKWRYLDKIAMPYKMYHFGYIKTKDERRVIIFGGKSSMGLRDEIWIFNLGSLEWIKSTVKCPKKSKFYAVKTRDGYVHLFEIDTKNCWKMQLSKILGVTRHTRAASCPVNLSGPFKFDVSETEEKENEKVKPQIPKEMPQIAPKNTWEQKVIELLHENQKLKQKVQSSEDRIDALIKQNVKLNKDMRAMERDHLANIKELQSELRKHQNDSS